MFFEIQKELHYLRLCFIFLSTSLVVCQSVNDWSGETLMLLCVALGGRMVQYYMRMCIAFIEQLKFDTI